MITNEKMAIDTAKRVVSFLNEKGIKAKSDYKFKSVRNTLRDCWYVKKLIETGTKDCIHIDLEECGSFLVVTDDCKLMSGFHIMVQDAIFCIYLEYVDCDFGYEVYDSFRTQKTKFYSDEFGDCGMFITDSNTFLNWVESLSLYN